MSSIAANEQHEQQESDDILRTAASIGAAIGLSPRQAHYLASSGKLRSIRKVAGRYWASRSRLIEEVTGSSD